MRHEKAGRLLELARLLASTAEGLTLDDVDSLKQQVRERIVALGMEPVGDSPADFKAYVDAEVRKYAERVRLTGIQPE